MSIVVDLVIVAIIAICAIIGYVKGLTGSLIKIISFVLSLVIAFVLFIPISNIVIDNTQIDDNLEKAIRDLVVVDKEQTETENKKEQAMPTAINEYINKKVEEVTNEAKENIADLVAKDVAQTIIKAGTWIVLFIVARIILILLKFITSLLTKLPVIKQFDKAGGVIYGLIEGLLITYFALAIISFVTPMTDGNLAQPINNSYIGNIMYQNNLLLTIIF